MDQIPSANSRNTATSILQKTVQPTVSDQVFDVLQQRILTLDLPPKTRISEAAMVRTLGVSRQPVREAFKRLAKLGFLEIRPQSGTMVSLISEEAVLRAKFIRTALEVKTCRTACEIDLSGKLLPLHRLIEEQRTAIQTDDRTLFHALDEQFHIALCKLAGVPFVWDLIQGCKGHMDRIRMLSLNTTSQNVALDEHIAILGAIEARDPDAAEAAMTRHLSRIITLIEDVKSRQHRFFLDASQ